MQRKIKVLIIMLFILVINSSICFGQRGSQNNDDALINNFEKKDIKIEVMDIDLRKENININYNYPASVILTMRVTNNGYYDIELANIDIMPYQGDISTKYFVSTSDENITGFIGNIKSKDSKVVKIGVALHNIYDPIKLEMIHIDNNNNEKLVHKVDIK